MSRSTATESAEVALGGAAAQPAEAELRLPRPPGVFRRWLAAHPRAVDRIIVGTYLFGCLLMAAFEVMTGFATARFVSDLDPDAVAELSRFSLLAVWPWTLVRLGITAAVAVALLFRRRFPLAGVILVSLLLFLDQGMLVAPNSVALVFLIYAAPVFRGVAMGWSAYACAVVLNSLMMVFGGSGGTGLLGPAGILAANAFDRGEGVMLAVMNALWLLAVLLLGINVGNRRRYLEALIDRAHQLARDREQRAQLAVAAERARIAREMHDIVAHSLSVVVTLSEAASVSIESKPEAAKSAMERAAETGRSALVEMRRLLGVLNESADAETDGESGGEDRQRAASAELAPQPGIAQLQQLVQGFREAGLQLAFTEQGMPNGDATQQLAVYRIVQEALTNSLRYAGQGGESNVVVEHSAQETLIEVRDVAAGPRAGAGRSEARPIPGSGQGLAGARERARLFGGELEAGPHGAGWRLRANVPTGGGAPASAATGAGKE